MRQQLVVHCKSYSERQLLLALGFSHGYKWHVSTDNTCNLKHINTHWTYTIWPVLSFRSNTKSISAYGRNTNLSDDDRLILDGLEGNLDRIVDWLEGKDNCIILEKCKIGTYTPEVYKDRVKIGCQTFTKKEFMNIHDLILTKLEISNLVFVPDVYKVKIGNETVTLEASQVKEIKNAFDKVNS